MKAKKYDLSVLPQGERYEDRYGAYLTLFKDIAQTGSSIPIKVKNAPPVWVPLLAYLDCNVQVCLNDRFEHDALVRPMLKSGPKLDRTALEVLCSFRPETADALWKVDMQWHPARVKFMKPQTEFIVTTNGSFHRQEIITFIARLYHYKPQKEKVVLVPCAADKPYPSVMHKAVLDMLPDDYYMANATGVLGIVPQDLWPIMPYYDSGIPNEWRLLTIAKKYFARNVHTRIVVYCDFYNIALREAFGSLGILDRVTFINPIEFYPDYIDLLQPDRLHSLKRALI